ncbi:MAG TPA: serine/threonine-protein kinase, partial [Gemmataceae bacterium]|nr:serine/threonine-protein kinase [Gemmataceae bacterium]
EFVLRKEMGQEPSREEFYMRFPNLRESLERQFQIHDLMEEGKAIDSVTGLPLFLPGESRKLGDRFEVLGPIGQGAMGVVYKVRDVQLNRIVALKIIREHAEPRDLARFREEAEKMARLEHPNIVRIYAVGEDNGLPYFSMELVEGGNLAQRLSGKPQPSDLAVQYVEILARAMHYAHQHGIVHRDLKPSNVVLTSQGEPKITDFGLAKTIGEGSGRVQMERPSDEGTTSLSLQNRVSTQTGEILGTLFYMAPEQAAGKVKQIGPQTDIHALGAILYELLTGRPPFQAASPLDILKQIQEADPKSLRAFNPNLDPQLEAVCLKCLEKRPQRRYDSADALAEDLRRWQRGEKTKVRPPRWAARVGRYIRRHWIVSAASFFAGVILLTIPVVNYLKDPNRWYEHVLREIKSGRSVWLLEEKGFPTHSNWRFRPEETMDFLAKDGTLSLHSQSVGLLELLPGPLPSEGYRLSAEIKHGQWSGTISQAGIFFGHARYKTTQDRWLHFFAGLNIDDRILTGDVLPLNSRCPVILSLHLYDPNATEPMTRFEMSREFFPTTGDWRKVTVDITPEKIRSSFASKKLEEIPILELQKNLGSLARKIQNPIARNENVSLQESLGLYIYRGTASFRLVKIEPLSAKN